MNTPKKKLMLAVTGAVMLITSSAYAGSFVSPSGNTSNATIVHNRKIARPIVRKKGATVPAHNISKTVPKKNNDFSGLNR